MAAHPRPEARDAGFLILKGPPYVNPGMCIYDLGVGFEIAATKVYWVTNKNGDSAPLTSTFPVGTHLSVSGQRVVSGAPEPGKPIVLAGSMAVPVYANGEHGLQYLSVAGESSSLDDAEVKGSVVVSWELTQVEPPPFK